MYNSALQCIKKRPISFLAVYCCCFGFLTFGSDATAGRIAIYALCTALFLFVFIRLITVGNANKKEKTAVCVTVFAIYAAAIIFTVLNQIRIGAFIVFSSFIITIAMLAIFALSGKLTEKNIVLLIFIVAISVRLSYVLYTGCTERQHDVESFGSGFGHAGYIEWFYKDLKLPDFDVREVWQFYHPPLHHIISAVFLRILTFIGVGYSKAVESIQMLTLFYSGVITVTAYKILNELAIKRKMLIAVFSLVAFHPTFTILSASINNDVLSIMFETLAVLYTIRWYKCKTSKNIIKIALSFGLGMFTKLSVWMIAPAIAVVFIYVFFKDGSISIVQYIKQFFLFVLISAPIGLFWSIRNHISYNVPPSYVPKLGLDAAQYIGFHNTLERLFNFNSSHFASVFESWGDPYYEYNPTIGMLKTAVFGEWQIKTGSLFVAIADILFYCSAVIALAAFVTIIINLKEKNIYSVFFATVTAVTLIMFYVFCFKFPFTCTQDARYIALLITVGAASVGVYGSGKSKYTQNILSFLCALFSAASIAVYI